MREYVWGLNKWSKEQGNNLGWTFFWLCYQTINVNVFRVSPVYMNFFIFLTSLPTHFLEKMRRGPNFVTSCVGKCREVRETP